jgi:Family of unknown function (DUF6461)
VSATGVQPGFDDWAWVSRGAEGPLCELGCLMFVHGADPRRVIEAFGIGPAMVPLLAWEQRWDEIPGDRVGCVRCGRVGEWAFAIEEGTIKTELSGMAGAGENIPVRLSAETEAVTVSHVAIKGLGSFTYYADGDFVTSFDPGSAQDRAGSDPDRFLAQMYRAGLDIEGDTGNDAGFDEIVAALQTATLALGLRLPEHVARGALLTGYVSGG